MSRGIRLLVKGDQACFTRPELKSERVSYDILTPSAARGILECIHWKPAISWVVDAIHVLNPISFDTILTNEVTDKIAPRKVTRAMKSGDLGDLKLDTGKKRAQRLTRYLKNVAYVIEAHFDMTAKAGEADNPAKHLDIFSRRAARGGCFEQPCLGLRQFVADFELIDHGIALPQAIPDTTSFGYMLWGIDYSDAGNRACYFKADMENGIVRVPNPGSPEIVR